MTVSAIPTLPLLGLSDAEANMVTALNNRRTAHGAQFDLLDAYYQGNQRIRDLGIAIPPAVRGLHTVVGWPRTGIDAVDERLDVEGFRFANSPDGDDALFEIWQDNNLDEESQLGHLDALIYGHAFVSVGSNDDGSPLITVESPRDLVADWDARTRRFTAALRVYTNHATGKDTRGTLYLPNETVSLVHEVNGWEVVDRDQHNLGVVMVERLANRQRTGDRRGSSEITSEVMSITDACCRTLLGIEVAREFYAAPQRVILGASESDFQNADGTPKTGWETYLGRVLALERDEDGNLPQVHQFTPYDPSVYTRIIDMYREEMSGLLRLPAYMLGKTSENPASADAIRSSQDGLIRKVQRRQRAFSGAWENVMRLALRVAGNGSLPADAKRIETMWAAAQTPTPSATSDAITKQIAAGAIPARSDVTREKLGYSVVERQRLAMDDKTQGGEEVLAEVARSLVAKEARTNTTIVRDAGGNTAAPTAGQ